MDIRTIILIGIVVILGISLPLRGYFRKKKQLNVILLHCSWLFVTGLMVFYFGGDGNIFGLFSLIGVMTALISFTFYLLDSRNN